MKDKNSVDRNIIRNEHISSDAVAVYIAMRFLMDGSNDGYVSYNQIEHMLYDSKGSRSQRISTARGFEELINQKYISLLANYGKTDFICDFLEICENPKEFTYMYSNDIRKIMNVDSGVTKTKLLRYFACLLSTFKISDNEFNSKIGVMPQSYISEMLGISLSTINDYNKILEENNILYIIKDTSHKNNNRIINGFSTRKNVYSRYEDRLLCDKYCTQNGIRIDNVEAHNKMNKVRSVKQKINQMSKGRSYSIDAIVELYHSAIEINKELKKREEIMISNMEYKEELNYIDMSIFDPYIDEINDELL